MFVTAAHLGQDRAAFSWVNKSCKGFIYTGGQQQYLYIFMKKSYNIVNCDIIKI